MYGIDMEQTQYSKLILDIPKPDIAISMGCNVGCPFIGRVFDDNWGLEDPTGKSDDEFKLNALVGKLENPNLFRFLYMGERSQLLSTGFELQTNNQDAANVYQEMAELLGITPRQVMDFTMTMMVYTQGIGTLIASGIVKDTKENMYRMLHNTGMTYLKGLGVKDSTLWDLSGGDRSDESSSNG